MYITVDIIFRKEHIRRFVESLSENRYPGVVEFPKNDRLNSIIRSYLIKPPSDYKPMWSNRVSKLQVPLNGRERFYLSHSYLQKKDWSSLESDFEDVFFKMYYDIEMTSGFVKGYRKELRIKFLNACGITEDVMTEDTFRKAFDRFLQKKSAKVHELISCDNFNIRSIYKSVV